LAAEDNSSVTKFSQIREEYHTKKKKIICYKSFAAEEYSSVPISSVAEDLCFGCNIKIV
jgi:hypothetical protein